MSKEYDPPMHSAEHILNQTMDRMFNCGRCINAHIEKKKSRIDYRFELNLSNEEIAEIERKVNEVIKTDLKVSEEFLLRNEAEKEFNLSKLPNKTESRIRIIRIGNYDACPCSGSHVSSTKEIGEFQIISTQHANGVLRLRYKLR
ncbi:MAG: hypothetical protein HY800_03550 [Ignavibacteriales bacterium]|nr:hypothetical protein [Ignavibacteriales bacterium]